MEHLILAIGADAEVYCGTGSGTSDALSLGVEAEAVPLELVAGVSAGMRVVTTRIP